MSIDICALYMDKCCIQRTCFFERCEVFQKNYVNPHKKFAVFPALIRKSDTFPCFADIRIYNIIPYCGRMQKSGRSAVREIQQKRIQEETFMKRVLIAVLALVPMIVIYVIFQKQFVEGIATSGGKL